jgi:WD40 repeat protein
MLVDPSGRYVVTYAMYRAGDSTIRVWTPSNGARIRDYSPTTISYPINRMLFTHGGEHLVIHTVSGRATWFGLLDGATGRSIPNGISGGGVIRFSPDRSRIVVGSWLTMSFYDAATGRLESSYPTEGYAIRFSQDGSEWFQVTPVGGRTIMQIRRTEDGSLVRTIDLEPEGGPRDISPDFGSIATVTSSQSSPILSVYDAATAQLKYSIQRGGRAIHQIAFSQDGQMFAAWGDDHVVTVYGTAQGNVVREIYQPNASGFEFGDDGASLLISSQSGILVVALPFAPGGERLVPVPPYAGLPRTSSDRRFLLSAMRTVDVYSYRTGTRLHVYGDSLTSRAGGYHTAAEFEPGGGSIVTITTFGDILRFRIDGILGAPDDPVRDAGELHIAPSIASDRVRVSYVATERGIARLDLVDPAGRRVLARERAVEGGTVRDELDVSGLATGVYLMRVVLGERVLTARVMVMR